MVAAMAGLRASELRGLTWPDVDLAKGAITVRQRADRWNVMGATKSAAGRRTIPLPPSVALALKEWRLQCPLHDTGRKDAAGNPVKELWLVFPNSAGNHYSLGNIVMRHYWPLQDAAGISVPALDESGKPVLSKDDAGNPVPVLRAKYLGLHALRHFFCSWCAGRKEDGGLGLPLKTVQHRMGHAKLALTADRYGHLFPSTDDADVLAAGERALVGA
jgi:integrase